MKPLVPVTYIYDVELILNAYTYTVINTFFCNISDTEIIKTKMIDRDIPIEVIGNIEEAQDVEFSSPHVDIHQLAEQLTRQGGKFKL